MDEREAAYNRGFPTRKLFGTDTEMAGTGFGCSGGGAPLVATFPAASQSIFFFLKYSLAVISESTCSLRSYRSGSPLERRGCKPQVRFRGPRMHTLMRAESSAADENS
jgi:hypothetical protein